MSQVMLAGGEASTLDPVTLIRMFSFRHRIFHDRLGWEVTSDHGMEYDHFDELNPVYILAKDKRQSVEGCWRLLPTTGPYMLKDTFPQLLAGESVPSDPNVWELSRFAVEPGDSECQQARLNEVAMDMMRSAYEFARSHNIDHVVPRRHYRNKFQLV